MVSLFVVPSEKCENLRFFTAESPGTVAGMPRDSTHPTRLPAAGVRHRARGGCAGEAREGIPNAVGFLQSLEEEC